MDVEYFFYVFFVLVGIYVVWVRRSREEKPQEKPKSRKQVGVCPDCGQRLHRYDDDTVVCTNKHFWEI